MAAHMRRGPVRSSTVIIAVMYASVVAYILFDAHFYETNFAFLPMDASALVGACFIAETVSLAKIRMVKEDGRAPDYSRKPNTFMNQLGVYDLPDFTDEAMSAQQEGNSNE